MRHTEHRQQPSRDIAAVFTASVSTSPPNFHEQDSIVSPDSPAGCRACAVHFLTPALTQGKQKSANPINANERLNPRLKMTVLSMPRKSVLRYRCQRSSASIKQVVKHPSRTLRETTYSMPQRLRASLQRSLDAAHYLRAYPPPES